MAGRLTEEVITRTILSWLKSSGWTLLSFDYPQSGTGYPLRPSRNTVGTSKNLGTLIPDVVAFKNQVTVFFENKVKFFQGDIDALVTLRGGGPYEHSIKSLHGDLVSHQSFFGVGLESTPYNVKKLTGAVSCLDFAVLVSADLTVEVLLDQKSIFTPGGWPE